jgi:hypothetical protein
MRPATTTFAVTRPRDGSLPRPATRNVLMAYYSVRYPV